MHIFTHTGWKKTQYYKRMFFIPQESLLSIIAEGRKQNWVNEVPVKALWNVQLAAGLLSSARPNHTATTVT